MLGWFKKKLGKNKESEAVSVPQPAVVTEEPLRESLESEVKPSTSLVTSSSLVSGPAERPPVEISAAKTPPKEVPPEIESKESLFQRLKSGLAKTRESFITRVDSIFLGKKIIDAQLLDEWEEVLITSDLGFRTVQDLLEEARRQVSRKELADPEALKRFLKGRMISFLQQVERPAEMVIPETGPFVILVLGVNGVGKTTTIGKLAYKFKQAGNKVLLVAADTFRAAAIDQIKVWGGRIGVEVCAQQPGADPSSVAFDALEYASSRNFDVIIIDTAGRLHTKVNLMEELRKIKREIAKKCPGAPHEVMLVLDATTGQNAVSQARQFHEVAELTGLTLTKLDGTAKGGIVVNISREFNLPIRFIGVGEKMEDLRDFDPAEFVEALFSS
ncbi:MAG: signal recognition particle-docking protein FtsY, partial [Desulfobulbaceae bacterium]|nr:signal recognition particle-docking protein FtsY [Desulfobulbaceae bacterium]